jgi:hypothetical protein
MQQETEIKIPPNFKSIIMDMTVDLTTTFPEYSYLWEKWSDPQISDQDIQSLFGYCTTVFPERFFDILYQTEEIFAVTSETNTMFLPGVEFKLLFNCIGVSEKTIKAMWKYLQLIMFTVVGSMQDKSKFGDAMNLFENVDDSELQTKMSDAISSMSEFFQNINLDNEPKESAAQNQEENTNPNPFNIPNAEDLHGHIKGMLDGKIGALAKEMAEEISQDMSDILGEDGANIKSTQDVLKTLMQNPKKITGLIKTVGDKLNQKISSGEISQEELMKEAGNMIGKMKEMSGGSGADFQNMFKDMAKNMGMNIPKNAKIDMNALNRMTEQSSMRDRLKAKMAQKKAKEAEAAILAQKMAEQNAKSYVPYDFSIESKGAPNEFVFKMDGDVAQTSSARPPVNTEPSKKKKNKSKK